MLDRPLQALITPALRRGAAFLGRCGWSANALSLIGFGLGGLAALCIAQGSYGWGAGLILASRLADGLDGALARLTHPTARGAFLDIALDFVFYAIIPLAFAWADPTANALAAATLLTSFIATGSSFLAFAVQAEKQGLIQDSPLPKGLYYLGGLTEATETLAVFLAMTIWPQHFAVLAYGFAALCALTWVTRLVSAWRALDKA